MVLPRDIQDLPEVYQKVHRGFTNAFQNLQHFDVLVDSGICSTHIGPLGLTDYIWECK